MLKECVQKVIDLAWNASYSILNIEQYAPVFAEVKCGTPSRAPRICAKMPLPSDRDCHLPQHSLSVQRWMICLVRPHDVLEQTRCSAQRTSAFGNVQAEIFVGNVLYIPIRIFGHILESTLSSSSQTGHILGIVKRF